MNTNTKNTKVNIPKPKTFILEYKKNNQITLYKISLPIKATESLIVAYSFGKGVRCFKTSNIVGIHEVGPNLIK